MPSHVSSMQKRQHELRYRRRFHRLKDAGRIWNKILLSPLAPRKLREVNTATCLSVRKNVAVLCYSDEQIMFRADEDSVENFHHEGGKPFGMKNMGKPMGCMG